MYSAEPFVRTGNASYTKTEPLPGNLSCRIINMKTVQSVSIIATKARCLTRSQKITRNEQQRPIHRRASEQAAIKVCALNRSPSPRTKHHVTSNIQTKMSREEHYHWLAVLLTIGHQQFSQVFLTAVSCAFLVFLPYAVVVFPTQEKLKSERTLNY